MGYLISETTKEEREKIVADSLGNIDANCDGCMAGLADMYQDYIDGKKELRQINMEFNARYIRDDDRADRGGCSFQKQREQSIALSTIYQDIFHNSRRYVTMMTSKLFKNDRSQAVRLPKECCFSGDEVAVSKIGDTILLLPQKWVGFLNSLELFR